MIKAISLRNFQAHKSLKIETGAGITTLKGPTDSGKSSVLRAVRWAMLNDRTGEEFITHGKSKALVKIELEDGRWIGRGRGKIGNIYALDGKKLVSFGAGKVPEPVENLLAVNEINFQKQHDSPFWLSSSGPEVSRQLNKVIDLSVIDNSLAKMAGFVRTARDRMNVSEERLKERREKLVALRRSREMINAFLPLKEMKERLEWLDDQAERLITLNIQMHEARSKIRNVPDFSPVGINWKKVNDLAVKIECLTGLLDRRSELLGDVIFMDLKAKETKIMIEESVCPLCGRKKK